METGPEEYVYTPCTDRELVTFQIYKNSLYFIMEV